MSSRLSTIDGKETDSSPSATIEIHAFSKPELGNDMDEPGTSEFGNDTNDRGEPELGNDTGDCGELKLGTGTDDRGESGMRAPMTKLPQGINNLWNAICHGKAFNITITVKSHTTCHGH